MTEDFDPNQQKISMFVSTDLSDANVENGKDDKYHLVFCEINVYDYFQNKKCLFKGLGKILVTSKSNDGDDASFSDSTCDLSAESHQDHKDVNVSCVQQVDSIYGNQLKSRFSRVQNPVPNIERDDSQIITNNFVGRPFSAVCANNSNSFFLDTDHLAEGNLSEKFAEVNISEDDLTVASEDSNCWNESQNLPVDVDNINSSRDFFADLMDVDTYMHPIDLEENSKILTLASENSTKEATNKLDYEMLLPHSVVESNSYINLQSSQSVDDNLNEYDNIYENLFDSIDASQDHMSNINEEMDRKENFNSFIYERQDSFNNDDESYLLTDISNLTQNIKKERDYICSKSDDVKCIICGRKCRSINALNHHMLVHSEDRPFVCEICKKAFKEQPTLRRHMWTHMDKQHQCDICEKYFVEKSSLRRHISTIHADFKPGSKIVQGTPKQQYCCSRCGKVFKSHTKFVMHQEMHGNPNYECEICGKVYAGRSHLKIHQRIHTGEKPYVCTLCNMKFAFKHVLKSHQARIHQKIHKFKCNVCSLTFIKKSDLSTHASCHMFNMKKGKRHYSSRKTKKICNPDLRKGQDQRSTMRQNFETTSTSITGLFGQLIDVVPDRNEKSPHDEEMQDDLDSFGKSSDFNEPKDAPFKSPLADQGKKNKECLECFKAFERMGDLKRHIISHIVENITRKAREQNHSVPVYECEICYNAVFKQVDKFKKHLREHASLTLYQCEVCDRAFGDSSNFSKHKKVHGLSFLKCSICNRKFNTKRMMKMHMEYHRHNKPKSCSYCKKLFHFDSNLRKHVKITHAEKGKMTYRCEECGERFNSVKLKWEHQWDVHHMRKVDADCHICNAQFRKVSLLRAHLVKEHTTVISSKGNPT